MPRTDLIMPVMKSGGHAGTTGKNVVRNRNKLLHDIVAKMIDEGWSIGSIADKTNRSRARIYEVAVNLGKSVHKKIETLDAVAFIKEWLDKDTTGGRWKVEDILQACRNAGYKRSIKSIRNTLMNLGWSLRWTYVGADSEQIIGAEVIDDVPAETMPAADPVDDELPGEPVQDEAQPLDVDDGIEYGDNSNQGVEDDFERREGPSYGQGDEGDSVEAGDDIADDGME